MSNEILYEVVIEAAPQIRDDYLAWLHPHIEQMLRYDGFIDAKIFIDTADENLISCHYRLRDQAAIESYLSGPAKEMRADGMRRFGDQFTAKRRILKSYSAS